jgi:glycosyltransferase involved in cell wall biosynthesis
METVLRDLAEGLVASGDDVTVLCAAAEGPAGVETNAGVSVVRSRSLGKLLSQPLTPFLPLTLHRLQTDFDVVHLHMPNPLAEAAAVSLPARARLVVTYHSDVIRQKVFKPLYGPVRDAILTRSRRIIVPTENHIRFSEVLPRFGDKCDVVPFGISGRRYELSDEDRRIAAGLRQRYGRFILFVGRLVYYKGITDLIQAMRTVDGTLVIAGDGPLRGSVEEAIRTNGLESRVAMLGAVPQPVLNAHLEACEVLVLPSALRAEGFGMALLEGMLFGKPLVTTRLRSGVRAVNVDGETGLQVEPNDPVALAAALNRLLSEDALRAAFGAAARKRVREVFSLDAMVRGYRDVYRRVVEG